MKYWHTLSKDQKSGTQSTLRRWLTETLLFFFLPSSFHSALSRYGTLFDLWSLPLLLRADRLLVDIFPGF